MPKKKYTLDEIKWLVYYGTPAHDSDVKIDSDKQIDMALYLMFDMLEKNTYIDRKEVERIFWSRIEKLANS